MGVISVTSANFDETVIQSSKPVLVDFWATWCGPCQMLSPIIESISEERDDIVVAKQIGRASCRERVLRLV